MSWGGGIKGDVTLEIREYRTNTVRATYDNTTNNTAALQGATIRRSFSTGDLQGKLVYLAFVDDSMSGYGGIIVSDIVVNASAEIKGKDHPTVVANGSFNSGLDGWTVTSDASDGAALGFVVDRINVGKAGPYGYMCENYNTISGKLFSFVNTSDPSGNYNNELVTGTLKSSAFAVNADAWLTLSWGGGGNGDIYLNLYRENGERIAQFNNQADPLPGEARTTGRAIDLSQLDNIEEGEIVYIEFLDTDTEGKNYSGIVVSDIVTNAKFCPEGYTVLSKIA